MGKTYSIIRKFNVGFDFVNVSNSHTDQLIVQWERFKMGLLWSKVCWFEARLGKVSFDKEGKLGGHQIIRLPRWLGARGNQAAPGETFGWKVPTSLDWAPSWIEHPLRSTCVLCKLQMGPSKSPLLLTTISPDRSWLCLNNPISWCFQ